MVDKKITGNNFIVCAFYIGNHYEVCARKLVMDCEKFGYDYDISCPSSLKKFIKKKPNGVNYRNWVCRYKPKFIRDMLDKHGKTVVYMDVDGRIRKDIEPKRFRHYKVGICHEKWGKGHLFDILASCIVFKPNDKVVNNFLDDYKKKCMSIPVNVADHWFLKTTMLDYKDLLQFRWGYLDHSLFTFASRRKVKDPVILIDARKYRRK